MLTEVVTNINRRKNFSFFRLVYFRSNRVCFRCFPVTPRLLHDNAAVTIRCVPAVWGKSKMKRTLKRNLTRNGFRAKGKDGQQKLSVLTRSIAFAGLYIREAARGSVFCFQSFISVFACGLSVLLFRQEPRERQSRMLRS